MFSVCRNFAASQISRSRLPAFLRGHGMTALLLGLVAIHRGEGADLARQFSQPPTSSRPWVWGHWLNGNVTKASITAQLEAIQRVGLGGVTMFDVAQPGIPAGPHGYFEASWQELFAHEIAEARRLGLEVMSANGAGYSGNGGPWITPELASQKVVESAIRVPGGRRFTGQLPLPPANGNFYRDVAVLAIQETDAQANHRIEGLDLKRLVWINYIKWTGTRSAALEAVAPPEVCIPPGNIVNLTGKMKPDGSLDWQVPGGDWTILRFGHTWTGQNTLPAPPGGLGPECDKLDKRGIQAHYSQVMKRMIELAGPEAGKTFHTLFVDSWEAGGQNWTEKMPEEFRRRRGYDIVPFLPVLTGRVIGDLQTSERFLYDLRQTVSELCTENFWAEMQRLCHQHGMKVAVEPYITTGNDLDAANCTDEPMGECWAIPNGPITDYRQTIKSAASAADLNGKLIVGVEAFTSTAEERWQSHPATLKALGDQMFCLGANRLQMHRFAMQRFPQLKPGMMMGGWGQQYDSTQTWWEWSQPWHDYLARCQFMLRQGPIVADVLRVVPEEPLYRFEHRPMPGYDYDACGPDLFKRIRLCDGKPGLPDGPRYELIQVEHTGTMTLARLKQLRALVADGANLLGEPPQATPGLEDGPAADKQLRALAAEIWGTKGETERRFGKGRVFRSLSPVDALARLGVQPDFAGPTNVTWIHRASQDGDVYFIASASEQPVEISGTFRIQGKSAELWNPETGAIRPLDTFPTADGRMRAQLPLGPNGSAFVVFRAESAGARPIAAIRRDGTTVFPTAPESAVIPDVEFTMRPGAERGALVHRPGDYTIQFADGGQQEFRQVRVPEPRPVTGPWRLTFPSDSGVRGPLTLGALTSWSQHSDDNVKHFSGTAVYRNTFELPSLKSRGVLDLGRVEVMASVKVNGQSLGILWKPPYRVDITEALKPGANTLEIAVVNLWVNRLIGDAALPDDAERDKNGRLTQWPDWVLAGQGSPAGRRSFVTFPLWKKDEPLKESGLLGPVVLHFPVAVSLEGARPAAQPAGQPRRTPTTAQNE
jgi:hypothetical protein